MAETLTLKRGDTWRVLWSWVDGDGAPIDLTGASAWAMVRTIPPEGEEGELLLEIDSDSAALVIDATAGTVTMTVAAAVTALLPVGVHQTDLQLTYPDGTVQSSATLRVKILPDVTYA